LARPGRRRRSEAAELFEDELFERMSLLMLLHGEDETSGGSNILRAAIRVVAARTEERERNRRSGSCTTLPP